MTPLEITFFDMGYDVEYAKWLIFEKKVNINCVDTRANNVTKLHKAVLAGNKDFVKFLIDNGADQKIASLTGQIPFHIKTSIEIIELLLNYDKSIINTQDGLGNTKLHYLSINRKINEIKLLQKYNPNYNIKNNDGKSAKDYIEDTSIFPKSVDEIMQDITKVPFEDQKVILVKIVENLAEKLLQEKIAAERLSQEKIDAERLLQEKINAERLLQEKINAEKYIAEYYRFAEQLAK